MIDHERAMQDFDERIMLGQRRIDRAEMKAYQARQEIADSVDALQRTRAEKAAWLAAHPQPQIEMFS